MEQRPDGTAHTVNNGNTGIVDADARFQCRCRHFLTCLSIFSILICQRQILKYTLYRRYCQCISQRLCLFRGVRLNGMSQRIQPGGSCHRLRHTFWQAGIYNCKLWQEHLAFQQHFHISFGVRNNGELCHLGAGSSRSRNGCHGRNHSADLLTHIRSKGNRTGCANGNGFHGIQRTATADADQTVTAVFLICCQPLGNHVIGRLAVDTGAYRICRKASGQLFRQLCAHAFPRSSRSHHQRFLSQSGKRCAALLQCAPSGKNGLCHRKFLDHGIFPVPFFCESLCS